MKLFNFLRRPALRSRIPEPPPLPGILSLQVDHRQHHVLTGGDFFDLVSVGPSRLIFLFADVAGHGPVPLHLAAFLQDEFRARTPELFTGIINEAESIASLCLLLNRHLLATARQAHMAAALFGALNLDAGTLTYINAGHAPALLLAPGAPEFLGSTGIPLGLFAHSTHEACFRALPAGSALLMASRGLLEARHEGGVLNCIDRSPEFGINGLLQSTLGIERTAQSLSRSALNSAIVYSGTHIDNDMSVVAISRDS